jgi:hypothetical protein
MITIAISGRMRTLQELQKAISGRDQLPAVQVHDNGGGIPRLGNGCRRGHGHDEAYRCYDPTL